MQSLHELATHDDLTGLYNHRAFYALLEDELARAQRFNRPVLLLLDIDHFKRVNDAHGHLAGDAVLKELGEVLTLPLDSVVLNRSIMRLSSTVPRSSYSRTASG